LVLKFIVWETIMSLVYVYTCTHGNFSWTPSALNWFAKHAYTDFTVRKQVN
jgi:hypothetical protein